jgi:hypothetical protein
MTSTHTQVECPYCGSFDTRPMFGSGIFAPGRNSLLRLLNFLLEIRTWGATSDATWTRRYNFSFDNPRWVKRYKKGKKACIVAICDACKSRFDADTPLSPVLIKIRELEILNSMKVE